MPDGFSEMMTTGVEAKGKKAARLLPYRLAAFLTVVSLAVAPNSAMLGDTVGYFLPWARASRGQFPWAIYADRADCNYPPLMLYLLTGMEAMRLRLAAEPEGGIALLLLKLPFILAHAGIVILSFFGLRGVIGEKAARRAALASAFCLPLFINAAVWGQADALLSLLILGSAIALIHERPLIAGGVLGLALSLKLQAIFVVPVLLLYAARRGGAKAVLAGGAVGVTTLFLFALPMLMHPEALPGFVKSYTGAVGAYPTRTLGAYNLWYILNDVQLAFIPIRFLDFADNIPFWGPLTARMVGILLCGGVLIFLLRLLWRNPTPYALLWATGISFFAFFMLTTQMHERYIIPGVAAFALVAGVSPVALRFYLALNLTAAANQTLCFLSLNNSLIIPPRSEGLLKHFAFEGLTVFVALIQTALFIWALWLTAREMRSPQPQEKPR